MDENEVTRGISREGVFAVLRVIGLVIGGLFLAVFFGFVFGYFVMLLWNWLMPELFAFKTITFWQAFGIVILGKLIFGGGMQHRDYHDRWHKKMPQFFDEWAPAGDHKNWKYYKEYWKTEGKTAFEDYLARTKGQAGNEQPRQ